MKYFLPLLLVCLLSINSYSQDIASSTINWSSTKTTDIQTGASIEEATILVTKSDRSIVWKNNDGSIRKNFQIIERIGEWENVTVEGRIQYEVTNGQISATISISRISGNIRVSIVLDSNPKEAFELEIQDITTL